MDSSIQVRHQKNILGSCPKIFVLWGMFANAVKITFVIGEIS